MKLSKAQNQELDSLKMHIETIEKRIENANSQIEIAKDCEDYKKISELKKAIEFGEKEITNIVNIQCESMG